jgi:hypothetical protein
MELLFYKCSLNGFIGLRSKSGSLFSNLTLSLTPSSKAHSDISPYLPYLILSGLCSCKINLLIDLVTGQIFNHIKDILEAFLKGIYKMFTATIALCKYMELRRQPPIVIVQQLNW